MKQQLLQEIEDLKNVIAWSKEHGGLSTGHRICIHQQIGKLLQSIDALEDDTWGVMVYGLSNELSEKVKHIHEVIKNTHWIKQEIKY